MPTPPARACAPTLRHPITTFARLARAARRLAASGAVLAGGLVLASPALAQSDVLVNHNGLYGGANAAFGPAGGTFTYQARVQLNAGPTASGVVLAQTLPVGSVFQNYVTNPGGIGCLPVWPRAR